MSSEGSDEPVHPLSTRSYQSFHCWYILSVVVEEGSSQNLHTLLSIAVMTSLQIKAIRMHYKNILSYFSTQTYVVGTQKNGLNETVLLST